MDDIPDLRVRLPMPTREAIAKLKGQLPQKRVAEMFQVNRRTVANIWKYGVERRSRLPQPLSDATEAMVDVWWEMDQWPEEKPTDDPETPPKWRCKCGRLVLQSVTCACGKLVRWYKTDQERKAMTEQLSKEMGDER